MSTKIGRVLSYSQLRVGALGLIALLLSYTALAAPEADTKDDAANSRSSISLHHISGGRANPIAIRETVEDHAALKTGGVRSKTSTRGGQLKLGLGDTAAQSVNLDYWFYDADVLLFNDDDNDGYFHGIDLLFDVDTNFLSADVFAVFYLSLEGGPWNEYAESEDFTIYGATSDDEYVLVSELMSGYPTGSYDLLIELFDAYDGSFLTSFGPDETSALSFLTLEDFQLDTPVQTVHVVVDHGHGGGGALDTWILVALSLLLLSGAITKIWRRRHDALMRIDAEAPCWQEFADLQRRSKGL